MRPVRAAAIAFPRWRATASISSTVSSPTAAALIPAALSTTMPRRSASARSILFVPTPSFWMTRHRGAAAMVAASTAPHMVSSTAASAAASRFAAAESSRANTTRNSWPKMSEMTWRDGPGMASRTAATGLPLSLIRVSLIRAAGRTAGARAPG